MVISRRHFLLICGPSQRVRTYALFSWGVRTCHSSWTGKDKSSITCSIPFDYFNRDHEWNDFRALIATPTEGAIYWHEEAVSDVFNITNGNPYFAKIVCSSVFQNAVRERDADVTSVEVDAAVSLNITSFDVNSFAHLWMDGIHKPPAEREPDILRRCRTLLTIGRAIRRGDPVTLGSILAGRDGIVLPDSEIAPVLNDFVRRGILLERGKEYDFVLPIFGSWLKEVGVNRLLSDALAEELSSAVLQAEDRAFVKADEISNLVLRWPTYQGRRISSDDVRAWLQQVKSHREQRILFKILKSTRFYEESEIRERLRTLHAFVRPLLSEFVQRRRSDRRMDVVVTYLDGEGKSGQYYASRYAEENNVSVKCIMPLDKLSEKLSVHVSNFGKPSVIVVIDDIVATGRSMTINLKRLFERNSAVIEDLNVPIVVLAMMSTRDGDAAIRKCLGDIGYGDIDFRYCEVISSEQIAFDDDNVVWEDESERDSAKALANDLGSKIYFDNPLGYGKQGLLIVFPTNCPNNSLPILHSAGREDGKVIWQPLFPRLSN
jgi:hypothetical protein